MTARTLFDSEADQTQTVESSRQGPCRLMQAPALPQNAAVLTAAAPDSTTQHQTHNYWLQQRAPTCPQWRLLSQQCVLQGLWQQVVACDDAHRTAGAGYDGQVAQAQLPEQGVHLAERGVLLQGSKLVE